MDKKILIALILCTVLITGCYPLGVGKEVRACKKLPLVIEQQLCLSQVAYGIRESHPKAAVKICEKEIGGMYSEDRPLEHIAGQIVVNGCLQLASKN